MAVDRILLGLDLLSALLCKVGVCRPCVRAIRFRGTLDECWPFTKNSTSVLILGKILQVYINYKSPHLVSCIVHIHKWFERVTLISNSHSYKASRRAILLQVYINYTLIFFKFDRPYSKPKCLGSDAALKFKIIFIFYLNLGLNFMEIENLFSYNFDAASEPRKLAKFRFWCRNKVKGNTSFDDAALINKALR
jgi:hypothetical protein